ncbi:MAG: serine/threonine-protein kinase [Polyangiaceae bacterium]
MASRTDVDPRLFASEVSSLHGVDIVSPTQPAVRYRLEHVIGRGGFAIACLAMRHAPGSVGPVVLKIWRPSMVLGARELASRALRKEAVALGRLNERVPPSPFVVRLLDTGSVPVDHDGMSIEVPWLAVEYVHGGVEGETLHRRVAYALEQTSHAFDAQRALKVVEHMARGLEEIHAVGVVHRDLKPSNVLCCGSNHDEIFKISDFGIARPAGVESTFGDMALGSPGYIPPEQLHLRDEIGPWTDVFALAGVLYFTLTGQKLFPGRSAVDAVLLANDATRPSVRAHPTLAPEIARQERACAALDACILRATAADPRKRTPSAQAFAAEVANVLASEPASTRSQRRWTTSIESARRRQTQSAPQFERRAPSVDGWVVLDCAWDGDGRCLAATTAGLRFFDGQAWSAALHEGYRPLSVSRRAPGSFLFVDQSSGVFELDAEGVRPLIEPDPNLGRIALVDGDPGDLAAVALRTVDGAWALSARVSRRWARPVPLVGAALIAGLSRIADQRWLVVGRSTSGGGYAAAVDPLAMTADFPRRAPAAALVQAAASRAAGSALAVGPRGQLLACAGGVFTDRTLVGEPNLSAVALDVLGNEWVAGARGIWFGVAHSGRLTQVLQAPVDAAPIVSLYADVGRVLAVAADGGVFAGRLELS